MKNIFRIEKKEKTPLNEFLSEESEIHALWLGFYSAFYTLKREKLSKELKRDINKEFHYFTFGFFVGRIAQAILIFWGINYCL